MATPGDPRKWLTNGVVWREFAAGEPVGQPLAEWAYRTPRFPDGITESDLRHAAREVQRETVTYWFVSNFKPYDLTGDHFFTFGVPGRGFGQAPFAPSPLSSAEVIRGEFAGTLGGDLCTEVAGVFPGEWMWVEPPAQPGAVRPETLSTGDLQTEIVRALDGIAEAISSLSLPPGGVGHNSGEAAPFSGPEASEASSIIAEARSAIQKERNPAEAKRAWGSFQPILDKLSRWLLSKLDRLVDKAIDAVADPLVLMIISAAQVLNRSKLLDQLLALWLKLHGG